MVMNRIIKQLAFRSFILLLIKIIGGIVRIPLFRLLGAEGVGLYQMVYSLYGLLLTFITGGLPTTLTIWAATDQQKGLRMLRSAVIMLTVFGVTVGLLAHALAYQLAELLGDHRLVWSIRLMAPAIALVPLLSLVRGYMQGLECYGLIAVSELIEQLFRVFTMLLLVSVWINHSIGLAVGGAVLGAVIGAWMALIFLIVVMHSTWKNKRSKKLYKVKDPRSNLFSFIWLIRVSFAISATRLIMPLSDFIDALIIPHRLQHLGVTNEQATAIYGVFTGMAASIVYLPSLVSSAVTHVYTSKMAADWNKQNYVQFQARSSLILQLVWLWGLGCSLFLYFNHEQLSRVLFGDGMVSKAIMYLCLAPLISGMRELTTTILWAANKRKEPMMGLILGILISSSLGYYLVGQASFSLVGIACELLALECTALLWNIRTLYKMNVSFFLFKPIIKDTLLIMAIAGFCFLLGKQLTLLLNGSEIMAANGIMILSFICIFCFVIIRIGINLKRNLFIS
jgi:stage V sporulation protein B